MAILGNNAAPALGFSPDNGRKCSSKFTLATAQSLQELHAWVARNSTGADTWIIHIYADSAGAPGARVAYTGVLTVTAAPGVLQEISQTGLAVPLPAGDYWLGITVQTIGTGGGGMGASGTGVHRMILNGAAFNPPSDPWGTPNNSGSQNTSVWAVVGAPASPWTKIGKLVPPPQTYADVLGRYTSYADLKGGP